MAEFLFIGAHPDDLEIGAGGTLARLSDEGHKVAMCILTDEPDPESAKIRRQEAEAAAVALGIIKDNVFFLGLPDGHVRSDRTSVAALREAVTRRGLSPSIVVTHTGSDSHNDHRAAHELVLAAFRKRVILCYSVPNSLVSSNFNARVFIDITGHRASKYTALKAHKTQEQCGRILWSEVEEAERSLGERIGVPFAEAFEVLIQAGAEEKWGLLLKVNDCPFHRFWYTIIQDRPLKVIHAVPVARKKKEFEWPTDKDRDGLSLLRRTFGNLWRGKAVMDEFSCGTEGIERMLWEDDVLISGGPVSNSITRNYYNHFPGLRYVIDYDMPDYRHIRILDRKSQSPIRADYASGGELGMVLPIKDRGILTVMRNPMTPGRHILGCMGIHGYGSLACYRVLSDRLLLARLMEIAPLPAMTGSVGYQVLVEMDVRLNEVRLLDESLHIITN